MDETPDPRKQEELSRVTIAKNMRNTEDILLDLAAGVELEPDEERLADLLMFQKHKQHVGRFKNPKKEKTYAFPVIANDGTVTEASKDKDAVAAPKRDRKDPKVSSAVSTKGSKSVSGQKAIS